MFQGHQIRGDKRIKRRIYKSKLGEVVISSKYPGNSEIVAKGTLKLYTYVLYENKKAGIDLLLQSISEQLSNLRNNIEDLLDYFPLYEDIINRIEKENNI